MHPAANGLHPALYATQLPTPSRPNTQDRTQYTPYTRHDRLALLASPFPHRLLLPPHPPLLPAGDMMLTTAVDFANTSLLTTLWLEYDAPTIAMGTEREGGCGCRLGVGSERGGLTEQPFGFAGFRFNVFFGMGCVAGWASKEWGVDGVAVA